MGRLKIGRLYIKPLYVALLTLGLMLLIGGATALLNHPAVRYEYVYGFRTAGHEGLQRIDFGTYLAKGAVVRGKLVVESGEVLLLITAENKLQKSRRVVDSGVIQAGKSFSFSLTSDWSFTSYDAFFVFGGDVNARFYCNLDPTISGTRWDETGRKIIVNFPPSKSR